MKYCNIVQKYCIIIDWQLSISVIVIQIMNGRHTCLYIQTLSLKARLTDFYGNYNVTIVNF